jgi:septal ring factor EnvC (AmiA/AmiB activator)
LAAIGDRLKAQRKEIATMKSDEQRLAKLIEGLARIAASPARPSAKRSRAASAAHCRFHARERSPKLKKP